MTATEFQWQLRQLAVREGMTCATFNALAAEAMVAAARRTDGARRAARKQAWLKQEWLKQAWLKQAGGAGNAGTA